jgi:hypothetical protein
VEVQKLAGQLKRGDAQSQASGDFFNLALGLPAQVLELVLDALDVGHLDVLVEQTNKYESIIQFPDRGGI